VGRRSIDSPKGVTSPEQIGDHSDASLLYPSAKPINTNPISTPAERAEKVRATRVRVIASLRRSSVPVGFFLTLPYAAGLVVIQQVIMRISSIAPGDISGAMFIVFMSFLTALGTIAVTYLSLKRADSYFYSRALRMLPVAATVLASVALATAAAFSIAEQLPNELISYVGTLVLIFSIGIVATTLAIFIWASRLAIPAKFVGLGLVVFAAALTLLIG
jgi:hypothetical protein